jgi:hypothetical protein
MQRQLTENPTAVRHLGQVMPVTSSSPGTTAPGSFIGSSCSSSSSFTRGSKAVYIPQIRNSHQGFPPTTALDVYRKESISTAGPALPGAAAGSKSLPGLMVLTSSVTCVNHCEATIEAETMDGAVAIVNQPAPLQEDPADVKASNTAETD